MVFFNLFEKIRAAVYPSQMGTLSSFDETSKILTPHQAITADFSPTELENFYALGTKEEFPEGFIVFNQNDTPDAFYIILNGEAEVVIATNSEYGELHQHVIAHLKKDDVIGDMALVENRPRSATVRAKTKLKVLTFHIDAVKAKPRINLRLTKNMAKTLSERLRYTNQVTVKKMEDNLAQAVARNVLGVFMVVIFWLTSLYTLSLTGLIALQKDMPNSTFISVGLIFIFAISFVYAMHLTGLPLSRFGISLHEWPKKCKEAILYSLPLMFLAVGGKAVFIYFTANAQHIPLFSGYYEGIDNGVFSLKFYLVVIFLYAVFSCIQELIVRCAMQSTFFMFLPGTQTVRKWNAIILANIIFAAAHSHLSFEFAALTFVTGIFWGWLFHKQRSLISVSISHIILGVWVVFIIGLKGILYGSIS